MSDDKKIQEMKEEADSYIVSGIDPVSLAGLLKGYNKSDNEIDEIVKLYKHEREKVYKYAQKFNQKIRARYPDLDGSGLLQRALAYAKKKGLSKGGEKAFMNVILSGSPESYVPFKEMEYNKMTKFFGFAGANQYLKIDGKDYATLDRFEVLFREGLKLSNAMKTSLLTYRSCDPNAITGRFDRTKDSNVDYIHPVMIALFLPRLRSIETRMLVSNLGRMIMHKSVHHFKKFSNYFNQLSMIENQADFEYMYDIAMDPNSMNYFSNDSPIENLIKRYEVQLEVCKNVLNLRSGRFFSKGEYLGSVGDSAINGLQRLLDKQTWSYFDSPEFSEFQDDGAFMRKLFAVFSFRPVMVKLSHLSYQPIVVNGFVNTNVDKITVISAPLVNVKLQRVNAPQGTPVRLVDSLSQPENYYINNVFTPKTAQVITCRDFIAFYVNRKVTVMNFVDLQMRFAYMPSQGTSTKSTSDNTIVYFDDDMMVGPTHVFLRSVVLMNKLLADESKNEYTLLNTSSAMVVSNKGPTRRYFYYNPSESGLLYESADKYESNDPISLLSSVPTTGSNQPPFYKELCQTSGVIYVYSSQVDKIN